MIIAKYLNKLLCGVISPSDFYEIGMEVYSNVDLNTGTYSDFYETRYTIHKKNLSVNCIQKTPPEAGATSSGGMLEFNANGETFLTLNDSYIDGIFGTQPLDAKIQYSLLQFITINT